MSVQGDTLRRFMGERAPAAVKAPPSRAILVGSGKGGVGTSLVAALLAISAASRGARALLVDADEQLGALSLAFGVQPAATLRSLRGGELPPEHALVPLAPQLSLLPGGSGPADSSASPLSSVERGELFRRASSLYLSFDVVVIDGGSRLDTMLAVCGAGVARLLAVTSADHIAVAATYALIKSVHLRFPATPVEVLVNRHDHDTAARVYGQLHSASEHFLQRAIRSAGVVPEDTSLRAAMGAGMTVQDAALGSPAALAVEEVSARMLSELGDGARDAAAPRHIQRRM
jgi:flagellar biosynthesis protein FlhG